MKYINAGVDILCQIYKNILWTETAQQATYSFKSALDLAGWYWESRPVGTRLRHEIHIKEKLTPSNQRWVDTERWPTVMLTAVNNMATHRRASHSRAAADEEDVIWSKAPEQLLEDLVMQLFSQLLFPRSIINNKLISNHFDNHLIVKLFILVGFIYSAYKIWSLLANKCH